MGSGTGGDAQSPGASLRREWVRATIVFGVLLVASILRGPLFASTPGLVQALVLAAVLLVVVMREWRHRIPVITRPWSRLSAIVLVMIALAWIVGDGVMMLAMRMSAGDGGVAGRLTASGAAGTIGAMLAPAESGVMRRLTDYLLMAAVVVLVIVLLELFAHGVVYSLLEVSAGHAAALLGSSVVYVALLWPVPFEGALLMAATACTGLLMGVSRRLSGSVLPAVLAQTTGVAKIVSGWLPLFV